MQFYLQHQRPALELRSCQVLLQLFSDPSQFHSQLRLITHVSKSRFGADAFSLVFFRWLNFGAAKTQKTLHEEPKCFLAKELSEIGSLAINIATGLHANGVELAFEDSTNAIHFACWKIPHEC